MDGQDAERMSPEMEITKDRDKELWNRRRTIGPV
jgi:hypothetical protein